MISLPDISAVIPTKGDIDMDPVLNSLPFDDIIVWDNSKRENLGCYGRFAAIEEAKHEWIYTQDDDIIVSLHAFLREWNQYEPGVWANKPVAEEWRFLGVGAIFHRSLIDGIFDEYTRLYGFDQEFFRVADVVFAYQHPYRHGWFGYGELEWSRWENRMYLQFGHMVARQIARERTLALPGRVAA